MINSIISFSAALHDQLHPSRLVLLHWLAAEKLAPDFHLPSVAAALQRFTQTVYSNFFLYRFAYNFVLLGIACYINWVKCSSVLRAFFIYSNGGNWKLRWAIYHCNFRRGGCSLVFGSCGNVFLCHRNRGQFVAGTRVINWLSKLVLCCANLCLLFARSRFATASFRLCDSSTIWRNM